MIIKIQIINLYKKLFNNIILYAGQIEYKKQKFKVYINKSFT